jgi:hypothetical protein
MTMHALVKNRLIREWFFRNRHVLFSIAGGLAAPASDAASQINQHPHGVLICFYLVRFAGFWFKQQGCY